MAQKAVKPVPPISFAQGKLRYAPDSLGNRIPDFSYCGYKAGDQPIPEAPVRIVVPAPSGGALALVQKAIDEVSRLPPGTNGIRGVVLMQAGRYYMEGSLKLRASGVILRGSGTGETIIIGAGKKRETLITIQGKNDRRVENPVAITNDYVPVNANTIQVANAAGFKKGDSVLITRPSTKEWIDLLGTDHFGGGITSLGWKPGQRNIEWTRVISSVNGNSITLDAPLTTALDKNYGGGTIARFNWPGRISNCGVENLQLESEYDSGNNKDEDHRWMAITIDNATDAWVRQVTFKHFAGSAVAVYENASRITVEDCISQEPVSEIGGERRNTFFTAGQQTLFQRCYAEYGMHDFATGFCAAGPNAFVQCESHQPYSFSGGIDSWASGVLFDIVYVDGNSISFMNRGQDGQGAGWSIANSLLWNCSAARIDCYRPPGAQNWALGSWSQFAGDGYWDESNNSIGPRSLYYAQLKERIGSSVDSRAQVMNIKTEASSSPSVEVAAELTKLAYTPAKTVLEFIREAPKRTPINTKADGVSTVGYPTGVIADYRIPPLKVLYGLLVRNNKMITGSIMNVPWWNGSARPYALKASGMAITRFVPGRTGKGLTDDLNEMTDSMVAKNIVAVDQNYGLWYDRRRDDHERIRRADGDVWTPFYELPFARSGTGSAWDGLSKYDLTKYNTWYWNRLAEFAWQADAKGLVLLHENYFQHNIIEAGAHYADFPWRPANNINNTGFPEPPPYAGDKRIFMAEQFYDTTHPVRRELHRKFIRQCLDNFMGTGATIQLIGEEFTGPLHFVQFWLNTIDEWEREHKMRELIGLSTTKDVQDAILENPRYASVVDVIDIKYWYYQSDGTAYAPKGGQSLAPRQHARLLKPKGTTPQQIYRAVLEYRTRYPEKAVIYSAEGWDRNGWAVLMAGGSLPDINVKDADFLKAATLMRPVTKDAESKQWILFSRLVGYIIYDMNGDQVQVDLKDDKSGFDVRWVNTVTGEIQKQKQGINGGKIVSLSKPKNGNYVLWLVRE